MSDCENKFWIENIITLFSNTHLIPTIKMSLEQQLNCMTRLVFVIFLVMIIFDFKYSLKFLVFSIIFIIIIYIIQNKKMRPCKENFFFGNKPKIVHLQHMKHL